MEFGQFGDPVREVQKLPTLTWRRVGATNIAAAYNQELVRSASFVDRSTQLRNRFADPLAFLFLLFPRRVHVAGGF